MTATGRWSITSAAALPCDLSDTDAVLTLVDRAADALGPITCLVNNASEFRFDGITDMTPAGWDLHLDINLKAPVFLAQALARVLGRLQDVQHQLSRGV